MDEPKKVTIDFQGRKVQGTPVKIEGQEGGPIRFRLSDGSTLEISIALTQLVRLDDQWNDLGEPLYGWRQSQAATIIAPDHLMKPQVDDENDANPD